MYYKVFSSEKVGNICILEQSIMGKFSIDKTNL